MGKKYLTLVAILICAISLTGCNGSQETDQLAYVIVMGLDKGEGEKINVTYQIAIPRAISGGSQGSPKRFTNITFSVLSIAEARNLLNSTIALSPVVYHVKAIVFGEELARRGIANTLGPLMRFREYRGSTFMAVTRGTAQSLIEHNKPPLNISPAKYFELMMEDSDDSGFYIQSTLHNFYLRLKQGEGGAYTVMAAVNEDSEQNLVHGEKEPLPQRKEQAHMAGELSRIGGNQVEFMGTALFRGDKLVDILDSNETRILNILLGNFRDGFISLADPLEPKKQISVRVRVDRSPNIEAKIVDGQPVIQIRQKVDGVITSNSSGIRYESPEYQSLLEERLNQVLTEDAQKLVRKTQLCGSDAIGLGHYVARNFTTWPEFQEFKWSDKYPKADVQILLQAKIRRTGLMWQTRPIVENE